MINNVHGCVAEDNIKSVVRQIRVGWCPNDILKRVCCLNGLAFEFGIISQNLIKIFFIEAMVVDVVQKKCHTVKAAS